MKSSKKTKIKRQLLDEKLLKLKKRINKKIEKKLYLKRKVLIFNVFLQVFGFIGFFPWKAFNTKVAVFGGLFIGSVS